MPAVVHIRPGIHRSRTGLVLGPVPDDGPGVTDSPLSMPPPPSSARAALGAHGEDLAIRYLIDAGLTVLDRNWRHRSGELDVVAREGDALVFCEVKTRRATGYGFPAAAVTPVKQQRLRVLARHWLQAHDEHAAELRFDVVAVLAPVGRPAQVTHLRAAF